MRNFYTALVMGFSLTAISALAAETSAGDHTSWRGAFIGQSREDLVKSLSGKFTVHKSRVDGSDDVQAYKVGSDFDTCGTFSFKNGVVDNMDLFPCFFSIDKKLSDREFAQILMDHYDIPSFAPSEADPISQRLFNVFLVYKGNTTHGETVTVSEILGDAKATVELAPKGEF